MEIHMTEEFKIVSIENPEESAWGIIGEHGSCPDSREGATAYLEKRKPRWAPYSG